MTSDDAEDPQWRRTNERLRESLGLPAYEPPRFQDGTHTFEVTDELESRYNCDIRFRGREVRYKDPWEVVVDQTPVLSIERRRDANGNTVFLMDSDEFRQVIRDAFDTE